MWTFKRRPLCCMQRTSPNWTTRLTGESTHLSGGWALRQHQCRRISITHPWSGMQTARNGFRAMTKGRFLRCSQSHSLLRCSNTSGSLCNRACLRSCPETKAWFGAWIKLKGIVCHLLTSWLARDRALTCGSIWSPCKSGCFPGTASRLCQTSMCFHTRIKMALWCEMFDKI